MSSQRKRMRRQEIKGEARFLTFSCFRRLPFFQNDKIKLAFINHLKTVRDEMAFRLWAWVLMPEHVHLVVLPNLPAGPISEIMRRLKGPFAQLVIARWRKLDAPILNDLRGDNGLLHFWQAGGGYDRNLYTTNELWEKIDYIHGNPIERGLVKIATDYEWSSARFFAGRENCLIDIDPIE